MSIFGRLACRVGLHSNYPQQVGRWYVNGRCTRCGAGLLPSPALIYVDSPCPLCGGTDQPADRDTQPEGALPTSIHGGAWRTRPSSADTQPEGAGETLVFSPELDDALAALTPTAGGKVDTTPDRPRGFDLLRSPSSSEEPQTPGLAEGIPVVDTAPETVAYAVYVGPRLATTAYDAARFRLGELETPMGWRLGDVIARLVLDSGAVLPADTAPESGEGR